MNTGSLRTFYCSSCHGEPSILNDLMRSKRALEKLYLNLSERVKLQTATYRRLGLCLYISGGAKMSKQQVSNVQRQVIS